MAFHAVSSACPKVSFASTVSNALSPHVRVRTVQLARRSAPNCTVQPAHGNENVTLLSAMHLFQQRKDCRQETSTDSAAYVDWISCIVEMGKFRLRTHFVSRRRQGPSLFSSRLQLKGRRPENFCRCRRCNGLSCSQHFYLRDHIYFAAYLFPIRAPRRPLYA